MKTVTTSVRFTANLLRLTLCAVFLLSAQVCKAASTSVLFVGNSYVYVNDLQAMFSAIAKSFGTPVEVDMAAPGGYSWQQHAQDKGTLAKISSKKWSFVVLQEQSQRPDWPSYSLEKFVIPYALQLHDIIHKDHAKTVFFETWGHKNGDRFNCANFPETCTYQGMQNRLTETYTKLARQTKGVLVPVGTAWSKVRAAHPDIELYASDGIHPSRQGTYLAACVFYSALFKKGVLGADSLGLPAAQAEILQRIAQDTVFHSAAPADR